MAQTTSILLRGDRFRARQLADANVERLLGLFRPARGYVRYSNYPRTTVK